LRHGGDEWKAEGAKEVVEEWLMVYWVMEVFVGSEWGVCLLVYVDVASVMYE
jgi:hypothetical protein